MKPAPFDYHAPTDLDSALTLLGTTDAEVKVLAGGQSLVPLLNFRLARPEVIVDIGRLPGLDYIRRQNGTLHIGALTTHVQLEHSPLIARHWPMLAEAAHAIAHPPVRNAGTIGGSLAHADPAAELPAALAALDAEVVLQSRSGIRTLPWHEFFVDYLQTALRDDELLVEIRVPPLQQASGTSFIEYTRRSGDFALGGAAVRVSLAADGTCSSAAIALLSAGATPLRMPEVEERLTGTVIGKDTAQSAAAAVKELIAPNGDVHASGEYRRDLIEALTARGIVTAATRAREGIGRSS